MRKMFHALRERWQSSSLRERAVLLSMTVLLCMVLVSIATNVYINTINRKASQRNIDNQFETVQRFVNKHLTSITDALHVVSNDPNTYILAALREMHSVGREKQYVDKLQMIQSAILHANRDFTSLDLILVRGDTVVSDAYVCDIDYYIRRNQIADLHLSLQQAYRQSSNLAISPAYYSDSVNAMNFFQHLYMPNSYFAVVLNISRNAIEIRLADVMSDAETSVYLLTPLGDLYGLYDGAGLKLSAEDALNVYAHPEGPVELAGEKLQARRAKVGSLRLLGLYPQTEMASALRHSALFLLVITGVFVAFAFLFYLEARNSFVKSAQALLSKYETSPGKDKQRNEYNRMDSIFQNMLLNIKSMEQRVKDAEEALGNGGNHMLDDLSRCADAFEVEKRNLRYVVFVLVIENAEGDFQLVRCRAWILALQRRWQARQFFDRNNTVMGMIAFEEQDAPGMAELAQSLAGMSPENGYLRLGLSAGHGPAGQVWEAYEEARIAFEWNDGQDAPFAVQSYRPEMMAQQGKGFAVTLRMQSVLANAVLTGNVGEMQGSLDEIYAENRRLNHYWQRRLSGHLLDLLLVFSRNKGEMDNTLLHSHLSWLSSRNNVLLRRHVYEHYQALTEVPMEREDEAIVRIRRYVEDHLGEDISLTEVAAHAGLSYNYVSTRFSEVFGMNFSNYLLISRLKKAKWLLQATDLPIAEVGRQAGYLVTSSFIRLFKKHEGITPGAYREMTQKESGGLR